MMTDILLGTRSKGLKNEEGDQAANASPSQASLMYWELELVLLYNHLLGIKNVPPSSQPNGFWRPSTEQKE